MKVVSKNPIYINRRKISSTDKYIPYEGQSYASGILPNFDSSSINTNTQSQNALNFQTQLSNPVPTFSANSNQPIAADTAKKKGGLGKFFGAIGRGIVKAEHWVVKESKAVAAGVKKIVKGKAKKGAKPLVQQKTQTGQTVFTQTLPVVSAAEAAKLGQQNTVVVDGQTVSTQGVPAGSTITASTDPTTGQKTIGVDHTANEVVAVTGDNGNTQYHLPSDIVSGMSKNMKIGLMVGGGVVVLGIITFIILRKKK